jgi:DNA-binding transcriptional regulator LsrR (DeoR family)
VKVRELEDWQLVVCCELFLSGERRPNATEVAKTLRRSWGVDLKHTDVYPILAEARRRGFFRVTPHPAMKWAQQLASRFGHAPESIHVVPVRGPWSAGVVAEAAAGHLVDLVRRLGASGKRVHLGFVGGRTVMAVARSLAPRLRLDPETPELAFHAVCSGFDALHPETAPTSFFGYFADVPAEFVGLFAPPVVDARDYEQIKSARGIVESFRKADEIDVVVTSLSSWADRHGPLKDLQDVSAESLAILRASKVVGDVNYCPYSEAGPILLDSLPRAMTLFQIRDLVELAAKKDKHVVLVGSPCPAPDCGRLRVDALVPLFANKELKVWSSVFLDEETAQRMAQHD